MASWKSDTEDGVFDLVVNGELEREDSEGENIVMLCNSSQSKYSVWGMMILKSSELNADPQEVKRGFYRNAQDIRTNRIMS